MDDLQNKDSEFQKIIQSTLKCIMCSLAFNEFENVPIPLPCGLTYCKVCIFKDNNVNKEKFFFKCSCSKNHEIEKNTNPNALILSFCSIKLMVIRKFSCSSHLTKDIDYVCIDHKEFFCGACLLKFHIECAKNGAINEYSEKDITKDLSKMEEILKKSCLFLEKEITKNQVMSQSSTSEEISNFYSRIWNEFSNKTEELVYFRKFFKIKDSFDLIDEKYFSKSKILPDNKKKFIIQSLTEINEKFRDNWKICYSSRKHGFSNIVFHQKCDYMGNLLILLKLKTGQLLGIYLSDDLRCDLEGAYIEHSKSFIFNIEKELKVLNDNTEYDKQILNHYNQFFIAGKNKIVFDIKADPNINACTFNCAKIQIQNISSTIEQIEAWYLPETNYNILNCQSKIVKNEKELYFIKSLLKHNKIFDEKAKLNLIYRATEDGFSADNFHTKCDNKPKTLSIIYTKYGNIIGGYSTVTWDKNRLNYSGDSNAFLFNISKRTLNIRNGNGNEIYSHSGYHLTYGSAHDLYICNNSQQSNGSYSSLNTSYKSSYGLTGEDKKVHMGGYFNNFLVNEIEIFQYS